MALRFQLSVKDRLAGAVEELSTLDASDMRVGIAGCAQCWMLPVDWVRGALIALDIFDAEEVQPGVEYRMDDSAAERAREEERKRAEIAEIVEMSVKERMSTRQIAAVMNCSHVRIARILLKYGKSPRELLEAKRETDHAGRVEAKALTSQAASMPEADFLSALAGILDAGGGQAEVNAAFGSFTAAAVRLMDIAKGRGAPVEDCPLALSDAISGQPLKCLPELFPPGSRHAWAAEAKAAPEVAPDDDLPDLDLAGAQRFVAENPVGSRFLRRGIAQVVVAAADDATGGKGYAPESETVEVEGVGRVKLGSVVDVEAGRFRVTRGADGAVEFEAVEQGEMEVVK